MQRSDTIVASGVASPRQLSPEWLDELPADDARAVASRKDLRRVNRLMGHVSLLVKAWRQSQPERWVKTIVELGAGDGTFLLSCARKVAAKSGPCKVILVDRIKLVTLQTLEGFRKLGWTPEIVTADVFDWLAEAQIADAAFVTNLFLHHFDQARLETLLEQIAQRAKSFIAIEPRRSAGSLFCSKLLGLIGCNDVTRHDAVISVRAGFKAQEISAVWPSPGWSMHEEEAGLFSHRFIAQKLSY